MADFSSNKPTFNIALGYVGLILQSLDLCSQYSREKDYLNWFFEQMVLYRWLSTNMEGDFNIALKGNNGNKLNEKDMFQMMEFFIADIEPILSRSSDSNLSKNLYIKLHRMELYLRKCLKDAGLEMKTEDDLLAPEEEW